MEQKPHTSKKDLSFLLAQYKVLSDRRINHNKILWELPSLFFTAQAFLIGLSLGVQAMDWVVKVITAFIAFFVGILSIQIFERNRIMEIADAEQLYDIEVYLISNGYKGFEVHHKLTKRKYLNGEAIYIHLEENKKINCINRKSSYCLWRFGLYMLTIAAFLTFMYHIFDKIFSIK